MKSSQSKLFFAYLLVSTQRQGCRASRSKGRRIEEHAKRRNLAICQWFEERKTAATSARMRGHAQSACASCKPIRSCFHERMGILAPRTRFKQSTSVLE